MSGVFQCKAGKVAIWDGGTDDAPFNAPRSNISRVKFHSDFDYPKIIQVRSVNVTLTAMAANENRELTHVLFSHGRPGIPYIEGRLTAHGVKVPFHGSVPVQIIGGLSSNPWARFLSLGADGSNVVAHESARAHFQIGCSAITIPIVVYITDELLT